MSKKIKFVKMHGLGNDFVMIDKNKIDKALFTKHFIKNVCDRRFGIGCDQFITYERLEASLYKMFINNADASKAGACGNATRAFIYLICENEIGDKNIQIKVENRVLDCTFHSPQSITVNMGKAYFDVS